MEEKSELKESKGVVNRIWQNETRKKKPYWVVAVQTETGTQERYSVWNWKTLEGIHEGQIISYKFETKGTYRNLIEVTKSENIATLNDMLDYRLMDRVEQIARMSAIKSATMLLNSYQGDPIEKMTKTLEAAKEFEKYIFGPIGLDSTAKEQPKPDDKQKGDKKSKSVAGQPSKSDVKKDNLPF